MQHSVDIVEDLDLARTRGAGGGAKGITGAGVGRAFQAGSLQDHGVDSRIEVETSAAVTAMVQSQDVAIR